MPNYKEIRYQYRRDIKKGKTFCILSGLQINDPNELSLEHFVPLCKGPYYESRQSYNIFPAFKIINGIKGGRLPCDWFEYRIPLLQNALRKGHLHKKDAEIVKAAIENAKTYIINPCEYCILSRGCRDCR